MVCCGDSGAATTYDEDIAGCWKFGGRSIIVKLVELRSPDGRVESGTGKGPCGVGSILPIFECVNCLKVAVKISREEPEPCWTSVRRGWKK
jgi:hypothetical protein